MIIALSVLRITNGNPFFLMESTLSRKICEEKKYGATDQQSLVISLKMYSYIKLLTMLLNLLSLLCYSCMYTQGSVFNIHRMRHYLGIVIFNNNNKQTTTITNGVLSKASI